MALDDPIDVLICSSSSSLRLFAILYTEPMNIKTIIIVECNIAGKDKVSL